MSLVRYFCVLRAYNPFWGGEYKIRKVKKMRKAFTLVLLAVAIMIVAVSCDDPKHEHSYGEWKYDDTNHWHECSCGEKADVAAHTFGEWTVDGANEKRPCSVCKYEETRKISIWDGESADTDWYTENEDATEYTLTSASQFAGLAKLVNEGKTFSEKKIYLDVSIDLNGKQWTPIGLYDKADGEGGDVEKRTLFSGTFDGQGHVITGLYFNNNNCETVALFGYVDGTVENFTVKGDITAKSAAGVVGGLEKGGRVENVTSWVNVTSDISDGKTKLGGIVLTVKDKKTTSTEGYTIKGCKNYGNITSSSTGSTSIGGILGWTSDQTGELMIENCENHGEVKATGTLVAGGIVGACRSITIKNCINSGNVSSTKTAGGIVGCNDTEQVELTGCKNTGTIKSAENKTGGIAGEISGSLKDCTTTGTDVVLVGTLGAGEDKNTILYSNETEITLPSVIKGNVTLENVKSSSLFLHYLGKSKHDLTVTLKNSAITSLVVTMEQNEQGSRLYLEKEGASSLGSLKFEGSFDRQNINTHGELYAFANDVIGKEGISNELIFINRDEGSADKDFGNASIYYVATGTSSSHTDSKDTVIKSVMSYNSSTGKWEKSTT